MALRRRLFTAGLLVRAIFGMLVRRKNKNPRIPPEMHRGSTVSLAVCHA